VDVLRQRPARWGQEVWERAAWDEPSAAVLRLKFLGYWAPVSRETLAAMFLWRHSRMTMAAVDYDSISGLSLATLREIGAELGRRGRGAAGPERLRAIAVEAHLRVTRRLLSHFLLNSKEDARARYCDACLQGYLAALSERRPSEEALGWFRGDAIGEACAEQPTHLDDLLKRSRAPRAMGHVEADADLPLPAAGELSSFAQLPTMLPPAGFSGRPVFVVAGLLLGSALLIVGTRRPVGPNPLVGLVERRPTYGVSVGASTVLDPPEENETKEKEDETKDAPVKDAPVKDAPVKDAPAERGQGARGPAGEPGPGGATRPGGGGGVSSPGGGRGEEQEPGPSAAPSMSRGRGSGGDAPGPGGGGAAAPRVSGARGAGAGQGTGGGTGAGGAQGSGGKLSPSDVAMRLSSLLQQVHGLNAKGMLEERCGAGFTAVPLKGVLIGNATPAESDIPRMQAAIEECERLIQKAK
jgi:hypothetical protein